MSPFLKPCFINLNLVETLDHFDHYHVIMILEDHASPQISLLQNFPTFPQIANLKVLQTSTLLDHHISDLTLP
jgi:hypothetical protein